jgi:soluble lytic murein transglycosylase-like protein
LKFSFQLAVAAVLASSACARGADLAVLRNGNSIRHERRQIVGAVTRLYLSESSSGYIEIPTDQIERFEIDTAPPKSAMALPAQNVAAPIPTPTALNPQTSFSPRIDAASIGRVVGGASERHQIDPDFINSVIRAESGFNNRAVSKKGAQGLMQLMPQTASQLGVANSFDPNANVEGGTKYLRELLEKYNFDVPKALAAYNAGPKRVDQYRGVPPYYETQAYVARIIRDFNRRKLAENPLLAQKKTSKTSHAVKTATATATAKAGTPRTRERKTALADAKPPAPERTAR